MAAKKVLIIRFSSIGDIVLTTPVIRALRVSWPEATIHFCTKKQYQPLLEANPHLDKIHLFEGKLSPLIRQLRAEHYDYIIDLHHNLRTLIIKASLRKKAYAFDKLNFEKWLFVNFKVNRMPNIHIVDRYLATLKPLGITGDSFGLDYYIPERDEVEPEWLPESHRYGFVAFAIGGQFATKKLPLNRMIELCDRINKPVILLGGKEDFEMGEAIARFFARPEDSQFEKGLEELNKKTVIFNGCGKFNINQSASLVKQAKAVFTHDTGLMHIAAAFHKKLFTIWGNTTPLFGMYPYRTQFTVFENNKINCRPCSKLGHAQCPKGHFKCMKEVTFDFYLP